MTIRCQLFLLFDGNCAKAMSFSHECLGGELRVTKLGGTPMMEAFPVEKHGRIINAYLRSGDIAWATDLMASPTYEPKQGDTVAIFITGTTRDEVEPLFNGLAVGAKEDRVQELHEMPFGTYGQLFDRYGVHWIFVSDTEKAPESS